MSYKKKTSQNKTTQSLSISIFKPFLKEDHHV
jgi:hypothetical protein